MCVLVLLVVIISSYGYSLQDIDINRSKLGMSVHVIYMLCNFLCLVIDYNNKIIVT